jgi:hypothetical protein
MSEYEKVLKLLNQGKRVKIQVNKVDYYTGKETPFRFRWLSPKKATYRYINLSENTLDTKLPCCWLNFVPSSPQALVEAMIEYDRVYSPHKPLLTIKILHKY